MSNFLTYQIELTPENAGLIDKVNSLLVPGYATSAPSSSPSETVTKATEAPAETTGPTIADVKTAAKAAKKEHGEDFANEVLDGAGVKAGTTLGRRMSAIDQAQYAEVIAGWEAGPQAAPATDDDNDGLGDDLDDDDDGLGDDTPPPTVEAVKTALKAYSKSTGRAEAKKIMSDNGVAALSNVDDCTPEQLTAMFKLLV